MLMSEQYKFIYLKTHKTGSTSVELMLEPLCAPPGHKVYRNRANPLVSEYGIVGARGAGLAKLKTHRDRPDFFWHHMGARRVLRKIGRDQFFACRRVACVRNPFTRLLSQFFYKSVWLEGVSAPKTLREARKQFEEFLFSDPEDKSNKLRVKRDNHLAFVNERMILTDYIRLEHMAQDVNAFLSSIGAELSIAPKHERDNASKKKGWEVTDFFVHPRMADRVIEIDRWVFELAGYSTDPADA